MRQIKYRAWYEDIFDGTWKMADIRDIIWNNGFMVINVFSDSGSRLYDQPLNFKLMQFTGHLDIKGQEIYEGDIVKALSDKYLRVIEWSEDEASFKARMLPDETTYISPLYLNEDNFEVLGNIFKNHTP